MRTFFAPAVEKLCTRCAKRPQPSHNFLLPARRELCRITPRVGPAPKLRDGVGTARGRRLPRGGDPVEQGTFHNKVSTESPDTSPCAEGLNFHTISTAVEIGGGTFS